MRILSAIVVHAAISFILAFTGANRGEAGEMEIDILSPSEGGLQVHYDFVMEQQAQEEFLKKLSALKIGDARTGIVEQLGQPTHDNVASKKENNEFIARHLYYYIKRWKKALSMCCTTV